MSWQIIRPTSQVQVGASVRCQVIHGPSGPRGQAAAQDIGWSIANNLGAGEVVNGPPTIHPATYAFMVVHSDSGFSAARSIVLHQVRCGQVIANVSIEVTAGGNDWSGAITTLNFAAGDVPQLVLPSPADPQCTDLSVSVGSLP